MPNDPTLPPTPFRIEPRKTGTTVVHFASAALEISKDEIAVSHADLCGRTPKSRFPRPNILAVEAPTTRPRYLDGRTARQLLLRLSDGRNIELSRRAPGDDVLKAARELCKSLGFPIPPEYAAEPDEAKTITRDSIDLHRAERAWQWLNAPVPPRPGDQQSGQLNYSVEGTNDLLVERSQGFLRIFIPPAKRLPIIYWLGSFFVILWLLATAFLVIKVFGSPARINAQNGFALIFPLFFTGIGTIACTQMALDLNSARLIEVDADQISVTRRGFLSTRQTWKVDQIITVNRSPGRFGRIYVIRKHRRSENITGILSVERGRIILSSLRAALGLFDDDQLASNSSTRAKE